MKKITLTSIISVASVFLFAIPAMAATTASLSPASINVTAGKSFNVTVAVNPQGTSNYVEKLEVDYPATDLEVTSFSLGNNWIALTQSGYDSVDNTNGILIKSAGYPKGISGSTMFGTITFRAKQAGSGSIKIGSNSLAYTTSSHSAITGNSAQYTVLAVSRPVGPVVGGANTAGQETVNTLSTSTQSDQTQPTSNLQAAVAASGASSANYTWLWILILIIIIAVIVWYVYKKRTPPEA